jgi:hypothetical protein
MLLTSNHIGTIGVLFIEKREYCVVGEWKGKEIVE